MGDISIFQFHRILFVYYNELKYETFTIRFRLPYRHCCLTSASHEATGASALRQDFSGSQIHQAVYQ